MIRARFKLNVDDYRPVNWPIKHPYWCSGNSGDYSIIIAYADDVDEILSNWPEARDIDSEEVNGYLFTERFSKPKWMVGFFWWLPECYLNKADQERYWTVTRCDPDTDKVGLFVGPLTAPISPKCK